MAIDKYSEVAFLDEGLPVTPMPEGAPQYNYKKLDEFCRAKRKKPSELSSKELNQFRTD